MIETILKQANFYLAKLYIQNKYVPLDKQMHALSGATLGAILYLFIGWYAVAIVSAVALAKELYDYANKSIHTPDVWDWVATTLGGLFGGLLTKLVLFSL